MKTKKTEKREGYFSADEIIESILTIGGPAMGARIKKLREERHMNQGDLAAALDVGQSEIAKIEQGKRALSMDKAKKLAVALHTTPAFLLAGKHR